MSNQQNIAVNDLNQGAKFGLDTSAGISGVGFNFLNQAGNTLNAPEDYYRSILAGGDQATAALAPDVNRTRQAAEQTRNAAETLAPRGGGRGSVLFGLPDQENSQIQSIFNTARPMAAQAVTQLGATRGQLGGSALGTGANFLNSASNAANSAFGAGTQQNLQQQQLGQAIASVGGQVLQNVIDSNTGFGNNGGGGFGGPNNGGYGGGFGGGGSNGGFSSNTGYGGGAGTAYGVPVFNENQVY